MRIHTATCASVSGYRSSKAPLSATRSCCMWYRGSHLFGRGVCLQVSRLVSPVAPVRVSAACLRRASPCLCRPPPWLIVAWWNCFRSEIIWNQQTWHRSDVCFLNWHFAFFSNQTAIRFDLVSAVQVVWCVMFSLGTSCKTLFKPKNFDIYRNIKRIWQFLNMNQKHRKLHIHSAN